MAINNELQTIFQDKIRERLPRPMYIGADSWNAEGQPLRIRRLPELNGQCMVNLGNTEEEPSPVRIRNWKFGNFFRLFRAEVKKDRTAASAVAFEHISRNINWALNHCARSHFFGKEVDPRKWTVDLQSLAREMADIITGREPEVYRDISDQWRKECQVISTRVEQRKIKVSEEFRSLAANRPVILKIIEDGSILLWIMKRDLTDTDGNWKPWRLSRWNLDKVFLLKNNFFLAAGERIFEEYCRAMGEEIPRIEEEREANKRFFQRLEHERLIQGTGRYENVVVSWRDGGFAQVSLIDNKPFVQQVVDKDGPWILWNLAAHPAMISILLQPNCSPDKRLPIGNMDGLNVTVRSPAPYLMKHAFVREMSQNDGYYQGQICMADTREKLLSQHTEDNQHSAARLVLSYLIGARRILRYGVRERDAEIKQFNHFDRIEDPESEFEKVFWHEDGARAAKDRMGPECEMVYYNR